MDLELPFSPKSKNIYSQTHCSKATYNLQHQSIKNHPSESLPTGGFLLNLKDSTPSLIITKKNTDANLNFVFIIQRDILRVKYSRVNL